MDISRYLTFVDGSRISEPPFLSPCRWILLALRINDSVSLIVAPVATQPASSLGMDGQMGRRSFIGLEEGDVHESFRGGQGVTKIDHKSMQERDPD
jgi:hypothetical protein